MSDLHLAITPTPDEKFARATLKRGEQILIDIESDDWMLLAAAVLIGVGYDRLRIVNRTVERVIEVMDVLSVWDRLNFQLVFQPLPVTLGQVTLVDRYSDELEEFRYDVLVNSVRVEGNLDTRGRWKDIQNLLVMLSA